MKLKFSFIKYNPNKAESKVHQLALIELQLIKDITEGKLDDVSDKLLERCKEIRSKLIDFPDILNKINDFKDIIYDPWKYEKLVKPRSKYNGKSSIKLTEFDRLIFDEREEDSFIVVEELFHYIMDWTEEYIENLEGDDLRLFNLLGIYFEKFTESDIEKLLIEAKYNSDKIWFFPDEANKEIFTF